MKSLCEIVKSIRGCGYTCEAGPLENNVDFQLLEQLAGVAKISGSNIDDFDFTKATPAYASPQHYRDEIIEKAKRDVLALKDSPTSEFIVNKNKRVVAVLLKSRSGKVIDRGIAKCAPDDCFNVHIGKAIALRRALGLEVPSEYYNAPQPMEVREGDIVYLVNIDCELTVSTHHQLSELPKQLQSRIAKIIDDSRENAKQEVSG